MVSPHALTHIWQNIAYIVLNIPTIYTTLAAVERAVKWGSFRENSQHELQTNLSLSQTRNYSIFEFYIVNNIGFKLIINNNNVGLEVPMLRNIVVNL